MKLIIYYFLSEGYRGGQEDGAIHNHQLHWCVKGVTDSSHHDPQRTHQNLSHQIGELLRVWLREDKVKVGETTLGRR